MPGYEYANDGEWYDYEVGEDNKLGCCDCGLVHTFRIRLRGKNRDRVQIQWTRDNRSTAMVRRHNNITMRFKDA